MQSDSIRRQDYHPLELIVVDNGSVDEACSWPIEIPDASLQDHNLGFAEGNNVGVRAAQGTYVVLLNNDTEVTPGWIQGLLGQLRDPRVAVVTSRVVTDGVPDHFYTMNGSLNPLGYNVMEVFDDLSLVFFAGGASVMFRRAEIPQPFPKEYFLYHEDVQLCGDAFDGQGNRMAQSS
jgi:GT2 family glycosyltransferase